MTTDDSQLRNKLRITGAVAGLLVWTALSGVGSLSGPAGFFLGLLVWWMLTGLLVWAVCSGETGEGAQPPVDESAGLPGWLLVVLVLALLVWIGLSGVGDMSGAAGFLFALLAIAGLSGIVIWARRGAPDEEIGDHRFVMLPDPEEDEAPPPAAQPAAEAEPAPAPEPAPDLPPAAEAMADALAGEVPAVPVAAIQPEVLPEPEAATVAELADTAAAPDDLKQIKGIGPALEVTLHEAGVTRFTQIAAWDEAEIDAMAARLGRLGGRIRADDWVGQARALIGQG